AHQERAMWRFVVPIVVLIIAFVVVQSQVANLMTLPAPGAAANNQPKTWMLMPLPKVAKPDPKAVERERWQKRAQEMATLLRPFARPYPFADAEKGYQVVFPGKPTTPMYRVITR